MSRSKKSRYHAAGETPTGPKPVSLAEYIGVTQESCRHGQCCRDHAALLAAYERYVNNPQAPWNKNGRRK